MNNVLMNQTKAEANADEAYRHAEQKASQYFVTLSQQLLNNTHIDTLTKDFRIWQKTYPSLELVILVRWQKKTGCH